MPSTVTGEMWLRIPLGTAVYNDMPSPTLNSTVPARIHVSINQIPAKDVAPASITETKAIP